MMHKWIQWLLVLFWYKTIFFSWVVLIKNRLMRGGQCFKWGLMLYNDRMWRGRGALQIRKIKGKSFRGLIINTENMLHAWATEEKVEKKLSEQNKFILKWLNGLRRGKRDCVALSDFITRRCSLTCAGRKRSQMPIVLFSFRFSSFFAFAAQFWFLLPSCCLYIRKQGKVVSLENELPPKTAENLE